MDDTPRWYPVMTKPQSEAIADAQLRRQGILTFCPMHRVRRRRKMANRNAFKVEDVERPYFSGYLFVGLRWGQGLYRVNETPAVSTVVYNGQYPLHVPHPVMSALMAMVDEDGMVGEEDRTTTRFQGKPGDAIRFTSDSPFANFVATIASIDGVDERHEIRVWLQMLGSRREISVPVRAVAKIV